MKVRAKVSWGLMVIACATSHPLLAAKAPTEDATPDMSFLEFLGAAIDDQGEFVDPLTLYEEGLLEAELDRPETIGEQKTTSDDQQSTEVAP